MAVAIPFIMLGMSALGAAGSMSAADDQAEQAELQGQQEQVYANWQAAQLKQKANAERASGQRAAIEERKKGDLTMSRARAVAAASGAGAGDPTVMNILGNLASDTEYNALSRLYEGDSSAQSLETQANALQWQGAQAAQAGTSLASSTRTAGMFNAIGQIGQSAGSFYGKYGEPSGTGTTTTTAPDISQRSGGLY